MQFTNPVGLAAGFDKNAEAIPGMQPDLEAAYQLTNLHRRNALGRFWIRRDWCDAMPDGLRSVALTE